MVTFGVSGVFIIGWGARGTDGIMTTAEKVPSWEVHGETCEEN